MPDESRRSESIVGEPTDEEIERLRWEENARLGRHGYAAKGTAIAAAFGGGAGPMSLDAWRAGERSHDDGDR